MEGSQDSFLKDKHNTGSGSWSIFLTHATAYWSDPCDSLDVWISECALSSEELISEEFL